MSSEWHNFAEFAEFTGSSPQLTFVSLFYADTYVWHEVCFSYSVAMLAAKRWRAEALRDVEKQCRSLLCGCDAVQHVNGYSAKPAYAITFVASVVGNGDGNGKSDRVLRTGEIPKTKRKVDSA